MRLLHLCLFFLDSSFLVPAQAQLLYLDAADQKRDVTMYVNSPGGSVTAGMAVFDTMRHVRPDCSTVCVGLAASMGAFLLASGAKVNVNTRGLHDHAASNSNTLRFICVCFLRTLANTCSGPVRVLIIAST